MRCVCTRSMSRFLRIAFAHTEGVLSTLTVCSSTHVSQYEQEERLLWNPSPFQHPEAARMLHALLPLMGHSAGGAGALLFYYYTHNKTAAKFDVLCARARVLTLAKPLCVAPGVSGSLCSNTHTIHRHAHHSSASRTPFIKSSARAPPCIEVTGMQAFWRRLLGICNF